MVLVGLNIIRLATLVLHGLGYLTLPVIIEVRSVSCTLMRIHDILPIIIIYNLIGIMIVHLILLLMLSSLGEV